MQTDTDERMSLNIPDTLKPRVVIIGGGFAGLAAIKSLGGKGFQVVLFDKQNYNTFHPLLYQVATAGLQPDAIAAPLRREMWEQEDFHFRMLKVLSVDTDNNRVMTIAGALRYDFLIVANGSVPNYFGDSEMKQHALPLKTIPDALNVRSHLMQMLEMVSLTEDGPLQQALYRIVIVGGGPTGVEMAGALAELRKHVLPKDFPELDMTRLEIHLLEGADRLLPTMSAAASKRAYSDLNGMGVNIQLSTLVASYNGTEVRLKDGALMTAKTVIWSAGVKGNMPKGMPEAWMERGRLNVDNYCKVKGSKNVFAAGDIAYLPTKEFPKGLPGVAQPAMQMGAYLGKMLRNHYLGKPVKEFHYFDKGSMATIGRAKAVADFPGGFRMAGRIAWFIWLFIHISYLVTFRHKILVFANWCWNFLTYDKGNRLIIRPFVKKDDELAARIAEANAAV